MRTVTLLALAALLAGCGRQEVAIGQPCGVISDSLREVEGKTLADTRRIDSHFERGVAAGCWSR